MIDIQQFLKERDEALLSLDKEKIMQYARKYGICFQWSNETVFWASVHKSILAINSATPTQKQKSVNWLIAHGFKPEF